MKGLLIKDLQLIFSNKTTLPIFVFITAMLLITGSGETVFFVVAYLTMISGLMVISTISYDEVDHSGAFLMTLPITRKLYTIEKYVLIYIGVIVGWLFSFLLCSIFSSIRQLNVQYTDMLWGSFTTVMVLCILLVVMIPIQLKFGNEKSRIFMIGLGAGVMVVVYAGKSIMNALHIDVQATEYQINRFFTIINLPTFNIILAAIVLSITLVSMQISFNIVRKKQY